MYKILFRNIGIQNIFEIQNLKTFFRECCFRFIIHSRLSRCSTARASSMRFSLTGTTMVRAFNIEIICILIVQRVLLKVNSLHLSRNIQRGNPGYVLGLYKIDCQWDQECSILYDYMTESS